MACLPRDHCVAAFGAGGGGWCGALHGVVVLVVVKQVNLCAVGVGRWFDSRCERGLSGLASASELM